MNRGIGIGLAVACVALACWDSTPEPDPLPPEVAEAPIPAPPPSSPEAPPGQPPAPQPAAPPAELPREEPVPPPAPNPESAPPVAAAISLEELGRRIRETPAIGTFTKLALKNDIDDLVDALRTYHERGEGRLDVLRERFEALVLQLLALLEDDEPELARALARSRGDIWSRLADPVQFAKLST